MHGPDQTNRRELLALGVGALVVATIPVGRRRGPRLVRRRAPVMGTIAEIAVVHADAARARLAADRALAALRRVDLRMSRFRDDSDIGRANRLASADAVAVGEHTAHVLKQAIRSAERTDGLFDPCLARAMTLWDVNHRTTPPPAAATRAMAGRRLYRALDVGRHRGRAVVRLTDADAAIDLGGIAKGYGVDLAVAVLRRHGVEDGLVNVGGDLYALGASEDGDAWHVGVRSPHDPARIAHTLRVTNRAIATSGDYEQGFRHAGCAYHHLLDPATGAPRRTKVHSVTIEADTCLAADAAATAVFGLDAPRAAALLQRLPGPPHLAVPMA